MTRFELAFNMGMFAEVRMFVERAAANSLEVIVLVLYAIDLLSSVMIDILLVGTAIGVTSFEFTSTLALPEATLGFSREACRCWLTATCDCRALQAWIPACHV